MHLQRSAVIVLFFAIVFPAASLYAQTQSGQVQIGQTEVAALRPELMWQLTSPSVKSLDGSVLYQIVYRSNGLPDAPKTPPTNPGTAANGRVLNTVGTPGTAGTGGTWQVGGNAGTTCAVSPCKDFLGTSDNNALEIRVGNSRALRIEPQFDSGSGNSFAPNVIAGFSGNAVTDGAIGATIAGGGEASAGNGVTGKFGTIGGGLNNSVNGTAGTVSGGQSNNALGVHATVCGGTQNAAIGQGSTIAGGVGNSANGEGAFVAGGSNNSAGGNYSLAAGHHASTRGDAGTFVWGDDSSSNDVRPTGPNQFVVRSTGGVVFYSNPALSAGVVLEPGSGSWASLSDRDMKEHFTDVNATQVLARVLKLPIATWNYKSQNAAIRHIGPAAQDFFAAFQVGDDNRRITDIDEGGVALAAIQGLNQKLEAELREKDEQLAEQQRVNNQQEQEIQQLTRAVEQLRQQLTAKQ